jgi:hypothetical protein
MHKPDFNKTLFKIVVTVHENCQTMDLIGVDQKEVSYQEVIGAIEIMRHHYILKQSGVNMAEFLRWQKEQKERASDKQVIPPTE